MANYAKTNIGNESRVELHDTLSLTGAEISINKLPAGANVPFIHSHKNNEEIYGIIAGTGRINSAGTGYQNPAPALLIVTIFF